MKKKKINLVELIKANPGCIARIDNDRWVLEKNIEQPEGFENWSYSKQSKWEESLRLADSDDDFGSLGDGGYGSGNCYGGDILQALAVIVGIKVESV